MHFYCFPPFHTEFSMSYVSSVAFLTLSPIQELETAATPCRGGRCAARYPHGPPTAKQHKYFDYDYLVPTEAASLPADLPEWGRVRLIRLTEASEQGANAHVVLDALLVADFLCVERVRRNILY